MNFDFSDDQKLLRDELRKFLQKESPLTQARKIIDQSVDHSVEQGITHAAPVWDGLASLGATSLMLPESCGGIGLGALELCLLAEEIGRQLSPVPASSTLYGALQILLLGADQAQQERWLPPIAQGVIGAVVAPMDDEWDVARLPSFDGVALQGIAPQVADGMAAQFMLVLARDKTEQLVWVVADCGAGMQRRRLATLDPSKPYAELRFDGLPAALLRNVKDSSAAKAILQRMRDRAAVLLAFEQLGAADTALDMAVAYARERKAFGRVIGSYQAIKHKLADLYTANQLARVHCYYGAWALADDVVQANGCPELPLAAASARVAATRAFNLTAQENIHVHGGMGTTWEIDCHLYYRRARQQAVALGSEHLWREQIAAQLASRLDH